MTTIPHTWDHLVWSDSLHFCFQLETVSPLTPYIHQGSCSSRAGHSWVEWVERPPGKQGPWSVPWTQSVSKCLFKRVTTLFGLSAIHAGFRFVHPVPSPYFFLLSPFFAPSPSPARRGLLSELLGWLNAAGTLHKVHVQILAQYVINKPKEWGKSNLLVTNHDHRNYVVHCVHYVLLV